MSVQSSPFRHTLPNSHYSHMVRGGRSNSILASNPKGPKLALLPSEFHFSNWTPVAPAETIFCPFSSPSNMPGCLGLLGYTTPCERYGAYGIVASAACG